MLPPGCEVTAGRQADIAHHRGQLAVQLLAEEVAPVQVLEDGLAMDQDAPLARQVVLTLHAHTHVYPLELHNTWDGVTICGKM